MTFSDMGWLRSRLTAVEVEDGAITLRGWAALDGADRASLPLDGLDVVLVDEDGDERLRAAMSEVPALDAIAVARSGRGEARGFDARFERAALRDLAETLGVKYSVAVQVRSGQHRLQCPLAHPEPGPVQRARLVELDPAITVRVAWEHHGPLYVVAGRALPIVRAARVHTDRLDFELELGLRQAGPGQLVLKQLDTGEEIAAPVTRRHPLSRTARASVPTDALTSDAVSEGDARQWATYYVNSLGRRRRLSYGSSETVPRTGAGAVECCPVLNRYGNLNIHVRPASPWLTGASWTDDAGLRVELDVPASQRPIGVAVASREHKERYTFSVTGEGGAVIAELELGGIEKFGNRVPLRSGVWNLFVTTEHGDLPVRHSGSLEALLPRAVAFRDRTYAVTDRGVYGVVVEVGDELAVGETGAHHRGLLQRAALATAGSIEEDVFLHSSYAGKQFSCNPAQVYREVERRLPDATQYVLTRDQQPVLPEAAAPLPVNSERYFQAFAHARFIITNSTIPGWWRPRPGQVVVQTWHGFTPAKRIVLDQLKATRWDRSKYDPQVLQRAAKWDYVLSNSPFSSSVIRSGLGYEGPILEIGTPRNDLLFGELADRARERVRSLLGVEPGSRIVLYAPTWRDQQKYSGSANKLELELDLAALAAKLGPGWKLLFRGHHRVVDRLTGNEATGVVDVSDYPEMQELLAAADVLVTDYSSAFVDFANTGRPMVFYPYDLEYYRDHLRGFYVDYEATVPGPIVMDQGGLTEALLSIDEVAASHTEKYKRFQADYCTWEDGHAAERLVDVLLDESR